MPVHKVGKDCYQWGNQKVYCGRGAKAKAEKQGVAIRISQSKEKKSTKKK